jgi:hypothetical protein
MIFGLNTNMSFSKKILIKNKIGERNKGTNMNRNRGGSEGRM